MAELLLTLPLRRLLERCSRGLRAVSGEYLASVAWRQAGVGEVLPLHPAGRGTERAGVGSCADRQPTEARPTTARAGQDRRVGPRQSAAGTETENGTSRAREGRRVARQR